MRLEPGGGKGLFFHWAFVAREHSSRPRNFRASRTEQPPVWPLALCLLHTHPVGKGGLLGSAQDLEWVPGSVLQPSTRVCPRTRPEGRKEHRFPFSWES